MRVDGGDQLMELVAERACMPLPRDRPLWAAHWVNGIGGGEAALVIVAHHVLADGVGGLAVLGALDDRAPVRSPARGRPTVPTRSQLVGDAWAARLSGLRPDCARMRLAAAGLRDLGVGRRLRLAPRTSLNRPTGARRRLTTVGTPLRPAIEAAHRYGCTVNDLVLSAVVAAMTDVLADRGEYVDALVVSVPYSSRDSARGERLGNEAGVVPFRVPGHGSSPRNRLYAVALQTKAQRTRPRAASAGPLGLAFRTLARLGVFRAFIDHQRLVNLFVTNVRGPSEPIRFGGRAVTRIVPVAVTPGNTAVSFDVLSYAGCLCVTLVADPDLVPDQADLTDRLRRRLDELVSPPGGDPPG
jgi:WS/DGAT/MGAT family acyltransferase